MLKTKNLTLSRGQAKSQGFCVMNDDGIGTPIVNAFLWVRADLKIAEAQVKLCAIEALVFADGVTHNGSAVVTSATASFNATHIGKTAVGAGIPALATIASVQSPTSATLSAPATADAVGVTITITITTGHRIGITLGDQTTFPGSFTVAFAHADTIGLVVGGLEDPYIYDAWGVDASNNPYPAVSQSNLYLTQEITTIP